MPVHSFDARTLLSADGSAIFAEAVGDPAQPAVIFGHGISTDCTVFDDLFARADIQRSIYAVRFDLRGHGRSASPASAAGYESARLAEDIQAIIAAFGLTKPFFAGWSLSAVFVADLCAASVPLAGVLFLSALPYAGPIINEVASALTLGLLAELASDDAAVALRARAKFGRNFVAPARLPGVPHRMLTAWAGLACRVAPETCRLWFSRTQDPSALFAAGAAGLPLLALGGTEDVIMYPLVVVAHMRPHFPQLKSVLLDGVGHIPFYEAPEEFTAHILAFVKEHAPA